MEKAGRKVRKWIRTGVVLVLVLLVAGCGSQGEVQQETTEVFGNYTASPSGALQFDGFGYLHFYSNETDSWLYLCNRPGCLHIDGSCGAYWGQHRGYPFYYNNSLYVLQIADGTRSGRLIRANRYGEERQEICNTDATPLLASTMQFVGDDLYYVGERWNEEGSVEIRELCRVNLTDGAYENLPQPDTGYVVEGLLEYAITDRYVYYLYTASDLDINDFFDYNTGTISDDAWEQVYYVALLYRMSWETGEFELLLEDRKAASESSHQIGILKAEEDHLLLTLHNQIVEYDPDTGETALLFDIAAAAPDDWYGIKPVGENWLFKVESQPNYFILLEDWKVVAQFEETEGEYLQVLGMSGGVVYFSGHSGLSCMDYENMMNGDYTFQITGM